MAKKAYIGVDGVARKVKNGYIGVHQDEVIQVAKGYTKLEYIQSTGTQYINTELEENSIYGIKMKFTVPSLNVSYQSLVSGTLDTGFTVGSTTKTTGLYIRLRGDEVLFNDTALSSSVKAFVTPSNCCSNNLY